MMNCLLFACRRKWHTPEGLWLLLGAVNGSGVAKHIPNNRHRESKENQKICLTFRSLTTYTGCPRRNVKYFGRVFLTLNYTDITQNTYIQS